MMREFDSVNDSLNWRQSLYWGGKAGLLNAFKREVLSRFPAIKNGFFNLIKGYRLCQPEVWRSMENRDSFSKITEGDDLRVFASFWQLSGFTNSAEREKLILLFNRFVAAFPESKVSPVFLNTLKDMPHGEELLNLIEKHFPDVLPFLIVNVNWHTFYLLLKGRENQREGRLVSIQKHLEIVSADRVDVRMLLEIPAVDQDHILTLFEKFDNFDKVTNYSLLVRELSRIGRSEREERLVLFQKHLRLASVKLNAHELVEIPAVDQEQILTLFKKFDNFDKVLSYTTLVKNLSRLDRSEREALIAKCVHVSDLRQLSPIQKNHPLILQSFQTSVELAPQAKVTQNSHANA